MKTFYCILLTLISWVAPAFATVSVSSPTNGATVTSPVHYMATATSTCSNGVGSMGIYVNNTLVYVVNGATLDHLLSLATGAQHTVVEEWDHCAGSGHTSRTQGGVEIRFYRGSRRVLLIRGIQSPRQTRTR